MRRNYLLVLAAAAVSLFWGCVSEETVWSSSDSGGGGGYDMYVPTGDHGKPGVGQPQCANDIKGTITGRVTAPNQADPVPGAAVYIPSNMPELFPAEVKCEVCANPGSNGNRMYTTVTSYDGRFTLSGVCPGKYWFVMQNGRFRRAIQIQVPNKGKVQIGAGQSRLPRKDREFSIHDAVPKIAVATGDYDKMECVLRKMGLDDTAYHLYEGAKLLKNKALSKTLADLVKNYNLLKTYNIVFINCSDNTFETQLKNSVVQQNLQNYVKSGGRLYVTDWSYDWIEQLPDLAPFIDFEPGVSGNSPETQNAAALGKDGLKIYADIKDPKLVQWLGQFSGAISNGKSLISHFLTGWVIMNKVSKDVKTWVTGVIRSTSGAINGSRPLTVTFNYQNCGKALFSSYHTEGRDDELKGWPPVAKPFPQYCTGTISPQDRILEYLIFDIANCVTPIK